MGCSVTFHDRIGRDRIGQAVEPVGVDAALVLIESAVCETVHSALGTVPAEVELTLNGDAEMERLNFDHMGERGPTDVLSFPLHEWSLDGDRLSHLTDDDGISPPGPLLLGDVVIDLDQALRQAAEGDWGVTEELVLLAIHGTPISSATIMPRSTKRSGCEPSSTTRRPPPAPPGDRVAARLAVRSRRPRRHDRELTLRATPGSAASGTASVPGSMTFGSAGVGTVSLGAKGIQAASRMPKLRSAAMTIGRFSLSRLRLVGDLAVLGEVSVGLLRRAGDADRDNEVDGEEDEGGGHRRVGADGDDPDGLDDHLGRVPGDEPVDARRVDCDRGEDAGGDGAERATDAVDAEDVEGVVDPGAQPKERGTVADHPNAETDEQRGGRRHVTGSRRDRHEPGHGADRRAEHRRRARDGARRS